MVVSHSGKYNVVFNLFDSNKTDALFSVLKISLRSRGKKKQYGRNDPVAQ